MANPANSQSQNSDVKNDAGTPESATEREFLHMIANHLSVTVGYLKRLNRKLQGNEVINEEDLKESIYQAYTASEKLNDIFCERRTYLKSKNAGVQSPPA